MVTFAKLSSNVLKAATSASKKIETALSKAKVLTEKSREKCRENLKSALEVALESLEDLEGSLELHVITGLSLTEMETLLSGAKADVKNVVALKCVNILSPRSDQAQEGEGGSTEMISKVFSDSSQLETHLRSALLCQPGDYPAIKVEVCDEDSGDVLSLDLQPTSVHTEEEEEEESELMREAGPHQLQADTTVRTAGRCQSLLTGAPLLARPTAATFLSQAEKEENSSKVAALHSELTSQQRSLVLRSADPHSGVFLLTPCPHLSRPPTFLLTEALTATDLLPFPPPSIEESEDPEDVEDTEDMEEMEDSDCPDIDVKELLGRLPHYSQYAPSLLSSRREERSVNRSGRVRTRAKAEAQKVEAQKAEAQKAETQKVETLKVEKKPKVEEEMEMDSAE